MTGAVLSSLAASNSTGQRIIQQKAFSAFMNNPAFGNNNNNNNNNNNRVLIATFTWELIVCPSKELSPLHSFYI